MSKNIQPGGTIKGNDNQGKVIANARVARARHLLVDLDGTLVRQQELITGAVELLAHFEGRYAIVSNNSTHTAPGLAKRLGQLGLNVPPERIVLAGELAVRQLASEFPDARVLLAASPALKQFAHDSGCKQVEANADIVLLALDMDFSHARLALIANELRRGARLLVSNTDATHPGPAGQVVPETGALLAAVITASGVKPWRVIGKPEPLLFQEGLRLLGARAEDTVVIGDNPLTDTEGAARLAIPCVLVGQESNAGARSVAELFAEPGKTQGPQAPRDPASESVTTRKFYGFLRAPESTGSAA